jgi:NADPH-dependent 2,4-dienoyl-CoA reductase/sulfur reductase-like enzyme
MHLVIIGGSDAGIAAGLRARDLDPAGEVSVLLADAYPNYSICGLPYLLSGDVPEPDQLAHRTREELEQTGITLRLDTPVTRIDPATRRVIHRGGALSYDALIIATGATPIRPDLPGLHLPGVHLLHTMNDALRLGDTIARTRAAAIIGAGYIGLEMAEALTERGLDVTIVEQADEVLPTVDPELGTLVHDELQRHGVDVVTATSITGIEQTDDGLRVRGEPHFATNAELVLVVVGVRPDTQLAETAGVELGHRGAIRVDRTMATSVAGIWATGDCVHTHHAILEDPAYLPLGTTAHKQGRVAGENALGGTRHFAGSLGTQIVKVFDLAIARTGLRDDEATSAGFRPLTVATTAPDHKPYYPGSHDIHLRLSGDTETGRMLGCQLIGHRNAEIAKRIDTPAAALHAAWTVGHLNDLDLSYTPPFGTPWDALQVAAPSRGTGLGARRQQSIAAGGERHPGCPTAWMTATRRSPCRVQRESQLPRGSAASRPSGRGVQPPHVRGRLMHRQLAATPDLATLPSLEYVSVDAVGRGHVLVPDLVGDVFLIGSGGKQ